MTVWALVPCSADKFDGPRPAIELYAKSALFRGARDEANRQKQQILILSALHHVLRSETVINRYNKTLNDMPIAERKAWATAVTQELAAILHPGDSVVSYLGAKYAEFVVPWLRRNGYPVEEPLKGMSQGARGHWFKERRLSA